MKIQLKAVGLIECEEIKIVDPFSIEQLSGITQFPVRAAYITDLDGVPFLVADMKIPRSLRFSVADSEVFEVEGVMPS